MSVHCSYYPSFVLSAISDAVTPTCRCVNASDPQDSQPDPGEYGEETPSSGAPFDYSPAGCSQMSDGGEAKQVLR